MDAALAALLGAGIGAVVPAIALVVDNRANRADARSGRVFDHRRLSYAAFAAGANESIDAALDWHFGAGQDRGDPPEDALMPLYELLVDVQLYGTTQAAESADRVFSAVSEYTHGRESNETLAAARTSLSAFVVEARTDLTAER